MVDRNDWDFEEVPEYRTFSDYFGRREDLTPIRNIVGEEIIVFDAERKAGRYGDYIVVDAVLVKDGKDVKLMTSSVVLMDKILKAKKEGWLPLRGRVVKEKRYLDIR